MQQQLSVQGDNAGSSVALGRARYARVCAVGAVELKAECGLAWNAADWPGVAAGAMADEMLDVGEKPPGYSR